MWSLPVEEPVTANDDTMTICWSDQKSQGLLLLGLVFFAAVGPCTAGRPLSPAGASWEDEEGHGHV